MKNRGRGESSGGEDNNKVNTEMGRVVKERIQGLKRKEIFSV